MGIATRSRRLIVTPGRFSGVLLPERFSFQRTSPMSHKASAWHGRDLARVVGSDKDHRTPQFDLHLAEALKVADREFG